MNVTKFVFKSHKWLAVATALITFIWFVSGIVMTIPNRLVRMFAEDPPPARADGDDFRNLATSIPGAIAALEGSLGRKVQMQSVDVIRILGRLHYRLHTAEGMFLINAADGARLEIDEEVARHMVEHAGGRVDTLLPPTRLERHTVEYPWGGLPAWRFESTGPGRMVYWVEAESGNIRYLSRLGRARMFLDGMHTLQFLNPWVSRRTSQFIMWVFSIIGTIMTLFGLWILWIQYNNWRERRATR